MHIPLTTHPGPTRDETVPVWYELFPFTNHWTFLGSEACDWLSTPMGQIDQLGDSWLVLYITHPDVIGQVSVRAPGPSAIPDRPGTRRPMKCVHFLKTKIEWILIGCWKYFHFKTFRSNHSLHFLPTHLWQERGHVLAAIIRLVLSMNVR